MSLPEIGDTITTKKALKLCRYFSLDYLIHRLESNPEKYKDWIFDGCSGMPDEVMVRRSFPCSSSARRNRGIRTLIFMGICS